MRKIIKLIICIVFIFAVLDFADAWKDKQMSKESFISPHTVGNSDSEEDQQIKLSVKGTVLSYLQPIMEKLPTKEEAMNYIYKNLSNLQEVSKRVLKSLGVKNHASVWLFRNINQYSFH